LHRLSRAHERYRQTTDGRAIANSEREREFTFAKKERKSIYIAPFGPRRYTQSAQAWITQFYLQMTPCLPFFPQRSPDGTTTATEAADIQLQLTTEDEGKGLGHGVGMKERDREKRKRVRERGDRQGREGGAMS